MYNIGLIAFMWIHIQVLVRFQCAVRQSICKPLQSLALVQVKHRIKSIILYQKWVMLFGHRSIDTKVCSSQVNVVWFAHKYSLHFMGCSDFWCGEIDRSALCIWWIDKMNEIHKALVVISKKSLIWFAIQWIFHGFSVRCTFWNAIYFIWLIRK